tara:strand:- start:985 stop:2055 length:1071 start_codon:yes stop_codon:yes gene_type:complete
MNPYENLPDKAFWKLAVANKHMFNISDLWTPKFNIQPKNKVATYGSCFAQHIGKALQNRDFNWFITENAPFACSVALAKKYNYGVFSARTGNIYTTSLLKQWTEWALGKKNIPEEVWEKNGRYFDPFRPRVEPNGFESVEEVKHSQSQTIQSFKESIEHSDYFVFTLGLTESWSNIDGNYEYPMCPGTIAGEFNQDKHKFSNQHFNQIINNLSQTMELMRDVNPDLKFILTVSPVPLTATKSGKHVAVATMASKSILRAVADQLSTNRGYVDYFPSYEIINSPIFKGVFFEPNQRSVHPFGVKFVMDNFFNCLAQKYGSEAHQTFTSKPNNETIIITQEGDEFCEEELLEAFGGNN